MKISTYLSTLLLAAFVRAGCQDNADGFASINGGTTGGNGGTVVTITTQADLEKYASASGKYVIKVPGRVTITPKGKEIDVTNDKTIIGEGASGEIFNGGFRIINRRNVIIRNLRIGNTEGGEELDWDGIQVDTSSNIWIDHCILERIGDGGIDIRKDTNYFTVSHTHFKGIDKAFGIGWTENVISQGTVHHCYFDGTNQRNPSGGAWARGHLYNNYLRGVTSYGHYARGPGTNVRVENVYFQSTQNPLQVDAESVMNSSGNIYSSCSGRMDANRGTAFNPKSFYSYTLDATANIPTLVTSNVGPRASVCPTGESSNPPPTNPPPTNPGTVPQFGQCGGSGWAGGTVCLSPFTCQVQNEWYSQCL